MCIVGSLKGGFQNRKPYIRNVRISRSEMHENIFAVYYIMDSCYKIKKNIDAIFYEYGYESVVSYRRYSYWLALVKNELPKHNFSNLLLLIRLVDKILFPK